MTARYDIGGLALFVSVLSAAALQLALYGPRLPERVAIHFNFSLEPNSYMPKPFYLILWAVYMAFMATVLFMAQPAVPLWFASCVLAFLVAVNQFLISANMTGGKLSGWFFVPVGLMIFLVLFFVGHGARR